MRSPDPTRRAASRAVLASDAGLAGIVLVVVIGWALAAVFMLSRTIVAAQQIDRRVGVITGELNPIDENLDAVELAQGTAGIAREIADAAAPLDGQLDDIVGSVGSIDASAQEIRATVGSIGDSVTSIDGSVAGIDDSVGGIRSSFSSLLGVVRSIDSRVAGINRRADSVVTLVGAIRQDTTNILAELGPGHGTPADARIHGHANSIDCSPAVFVRSRHCGR